MGTLGIILIIVGSLAFIAILIVLLYVFAFSHRKYKKQVRDLEAKYSYLDALLVGTDAQYVHNLEIISRTNLLYVEKYNIYHKKFQEVLNNDDRYVDAMLKQLHSLMQSGQYKNIKIVISDARAAVAAFEDAVNALDAELYELVKPEEQARQEILKLKENYRRVKQSYYSNANDLEIVSASFSKIFEKLDLKFGDFENHIECAEYDEANELLPQIANVIKALEETLTVLPNLCVMVQSVVPEKIEELTNEYNSTERMGVPLFNISYRQKVEEWKKSLQALRNQLVNLQTQGIKEEIERILAEMEQIREKLGVEVDDKVIFEEAADKLYRKAILLEKDFLKVCQLLPEIEKVYVISDEQKQSIVELKNSMNRMGGSKRTLDNFVHSGTKQPYSILRKKLDDLQLTYDEASSGLTTFKAYIDSLRTSCEEAYSLVFIYYYRCKQSEAILREIGIESFMQRYEAQVDTCYELLNDIDSSLKVKPIDVSAINEKVEQLKAIGNKLFDEVENKHREEQLAESTIVYANRDRNHQADVHQQLSLLEDAFFEGEFVRVYHDANAIYRRSHVEDNNGNADK